MSEATRWYIYVGIFVVSLVAIIAGLTTEADLTAAITSAGAVAASGLAALNTTRKPPPE